MKEVWIQVFYLKVLMLRQFCPNPNTLNFLPLNCFSNFKISHSIFPFWRVLKKYIFSITSFKFYLIYTCSICGKCILITLCWLLYYSMHFLLLPCSYSMKGWKLSSAVWEQMVMANSNYLCYEVSLTVLTVISSHLKNMD